MISDTAVVLKPAIVLDHEQLPQREPRRRRVRAVVERRKRVRDREEEEEEEGQPDERKERKLDDPESVKGTGVSLLDAETALRLENLQIKHVCRSDGRP